MAIPIKNTPVIKDKDATRFYQKLQKSKDKKPLQEELLRIKSNYEKIKAICKD